MKGWLVWQDHHGFGWTFAHYVGAPGCAPLCGFRWEQGMRGRLGAQEAPADSSRCKNCTRLLHDSPVRRAV